MSDAEFHSSQTYDFSFSKQSKQKLVAPSLPPGLLPGILSPAVKRRERKVYQLLSGDDDKNEWRDTPAKHLSLHCTDRESYTLIKRCALLVTTLHKMGPV